jgi:hypothetical protein
LFKCGFEIFNDFLGENIGIGKVIGFIKAFVSEPEDVEAGLVAGKSRIKRFGLISLARSRRLIPYFVHRRGF